MKFIIIPAALLLGAAVFVALLIIVKGGYFATKRRKTKLGLVKVAGAGLKLSEEDEPEGSEGRPAAAEAGVEEAEPVSIITSASDSVDINAGVDKYDDAAAGDAEDDAPAALGELPDEPDSHGNIEREKTSAAPAESINKDKTGEAVVRILPKPQVSGGDAVRRSDTRPLSEKLPMIDEDPGPVGPVRKIVDLPVENPFLGGKSAAGDHAKKTTATQRRRLPETVKMKDRKVILAEDVAINRDLIAMYFDGSGIKFEFAVNGREVCEKFERDPSAYSLILMDIQMPEMDGYEVSRRIRAMDVDWAKQIPIIAMTGNDQKEDIDLCFEAGMDDHIPKPIDMEVLQEKVFDILTLSAESF
ncbi:hypothetical protein R80B4_01378 [Fibrobacteres bacterium R8-0-B4]